MSRHIAVILVAVGVFLAVVRCPADSPEAARAREVVEGLVGHELPGAQVDVEDVGAVRTARVRVQDNQDVIEHVVDLTKGELIGYVRLGQGPPVTEELALTEEEARVLAEAEVQRCLGDAALGLEWAAPRHDGPEVEFRGVVPPEPGAPAGLTCEVAVRLDTGKVVRYSQSAAPPSAEGVAITSDDAVRVALDDLGPGSTPAREPILNTYHDGRLVWYVEAIPPAGGMAHVYHVNAMTGAIDSHGVPDARALPPSSADGVAPSTSILRVVGMAAGAAVLAALGLLTVARRRRRQTPRREA